MARAQNTDVFQTFKFQVVDKNGGDVLGSKAEGGFSTCSMPQLTLDVIEYKEGIHTYRRKYPGIPTVSDVTLTRGRALKRSSLHRWALACVNGNEYRTDLIINVFHRQDYLTGVNDTSGDLSLLAQPNATLKINLKQCFASDFRPGADLDAQASDVFVEELVVTCESFDIVESAVTIVANAGIKQN
jgi:phage tail-like protein